MYAYFGIIGHFLPDMLLTSQGSATGALREISYLIIIIPITAALGFWAVISYLDTIKHAQKNLISLMVWVLVLLAVIITPNYGHDILSSKNFRGGLYQ